MMIVRMIVRMIFNTIIVGYVRCNGVNLNFFVF